jgi:hypothetical protein
MDAQARKSSNNYSMAASVAPALFTKPDNRAKLISILGNRNFSFRPALPGCQKIPTESSTRPKLNRKISNEIKRRRERLRERGANLAAHIQHEQTGTNRPAQTG